MGLTKEQIQHIKACCQKYRSSGGEDHDSCTADMLALIETIEEMVTKAAHKGAEEVDTEAPTN